MFADDVVLCAREKDELELELEQLRQALGKRGMKVSKANTAVTDHRIQVSGKHPADRW